jgi:hypothetical protein
MSAVVQDVAKTIAKLRILHIFAMLNPSEPSLSLA